jgi:hypothetical protein
MIGRFLDTYVKTAGAPSLADIRAVLWTAKGEAASSGAADERAVILEQYKIYTEMADRVSARRGLANTFFLTLNTAAISAVGLSLGTGLGGSRWAYSLLFVGLIVQCIAWFWIIRSYRQLNTAKYAVVGALEERLPASPYWAAEWMALGEGKDPARYWPLTHLESWVPALFALVYAFGFVATLVSA